MPATRDLENRFIVITGANTGIGRVTAERLAERGASLVLACRSEDRTRSVLEAIRAAGGDAQFSALDLGDFASVRACAERLLALDRPIDILINNAGLAGKRGLTKDGFEVAFGTNHLGHFLLTVLLAPRLRRAPRPGDDHSEAEPGARHSRIVNVASKAHYGAKGIDFAAVRTSTRTLAGLREYEVSKLANVLFTKELARRLGGANVHSYALHPGVVASDIWRKIPWPVRWFVTRAMISNEEGAQTTLHCATSKEVADDNGCYYDESREKKPSPLADDAELARTLWEKSVEWVGADL